MSTAELSAPRGDTPAARDGASLAGHALPRNGLRGWLRLLGSELRLMFRRWRNLALLGVLVVLPVVLGIGLRVSSRTAAAAVAGRTRRSSPSWPGTGCSCPSWP